MRKTINSKHNLNDVVAFKRGSVVEYGRITDINANIEKDNVTLEYYVVPKEEQIELASIIENFGQHDYEEEEEEEESLPESCGGF